MSMPQSTPASDLEELLVGEKVVVDSYYTTYVDGVLGGLTETAVYVAEVDGVQYTSLQEAIRNGSILPLNWSPAVALP